MDKTPKQKVKEVFGKNADKYVTSDSHAKGDDLSLLVEWLQPENTWTVLDIATGGGHVTKTLAPHAGTVFSTDLTEEMLENTAKHLRDSFDNIHYVVADAEALPFLKETFDAAICRIAPHHFPNPERFIAEMSRVLKKGGRFVLIDNVAPADSELAQFMNTTEKLRDDSHSRCLSKEEWKMLLEENGMVERKSADRRKTFDYPSWVERTTESKEQIERVSRHLLNSNEKTADYFSIEVQDGKVQTFTIDEWMALYEKAD
ncbi:ubiquinone/menaquinone biosynthesis C-methylase UbiE [Planomicrobium stackebrandtii]|uniref:Ubiquinone/menaquinone biosynthesis C-methylase UbiE n=1 Tax=Planomicrobium stackebrandtii TaxID=253160 RepID=A0ABU0GTN5_9BACL|nr:methyltransferase domain-containing protein [Planomicrobium stackebrandtii]MDQ0428136.1 ubiquinone/menaquinone biosynthesis C-methylase UbiE [Planomicrobium stackebrandtii]